MTETQTVPVTDEFGAADDPAMPFLSLALDPHEVERQLAGCLPTLTARNKSFQLRAIRGVRHKLGRRCLIEYDIETAVDGRQTEAHTLIGKARAKGLDESTYHLLVALRKAAFGANSDDEILVPEPVGIIPKFHMWLQWKVPGVTASRILAQPGGIALAGRVAAAAHKLHTAAIPATRRHTMTDELQILHKRLPLVAELRPEWAGRIERIMAASNRLGAATPELSTVGIHRDFYADQVLVAQRGERLYLLDFDLYCEGDPGLDIGNFVGHMTEQALRTTGDPRAFSRQEDALVDRFVELAGETVRPAIQAYTILTLVRHIYLSTQFADRRHTTAALLEMCEECLDIGSAR